jgi:hypothetical protein
MANISISDLRPAGVDFFSDSENYLNDLTDDELNTRGGISPIVVRIVIAAAAVAQGFYTGHKQGKSDMCPR